MTQTKLIDSIAKAIHSNPAFVEIEAGYSFYNPSSVNGPFGKFDLQIFSDNTVSGTMDIQTIWGLGTTTKLQLSGTYKEKANQHYFKLIGKGYESANLGKKKHYVEMEVSIEIEANWEKGKVAFGVSLPEVFGGLPAKMVYFRQPN
ncbi:hypothetical protein ACFSTE_18730 [Aquimarina hainanensis]|uniref:DUF1842 domain-containing protein n=1 Tax=Aquimarina hainanensis TaxID=1578017 RepID=A0ABW5NBB1_9FLAO|nr:hypothetical protein [Aquimarina sp. TRL1]QKX06636.1 hypothetical protein HN014_17520 [Aquimarina sp. TRL1]